MPRLAVNPLLRALAPPPVPAVQAFLEAYDGRLGPPVDLAQAVPDLAPPPALAGALARAAADPRTARYGPIAGDDVLRAAYADHVAALYGAEVAPAEVVVTAGCNQAFFVAMLALAAPGEEVVLTTPNYFNHAATVEMLGIRVSPLPLSPGRGFVPTPQAAEAALAGGAKALVLVSPSNPTGAVVPAGRLREILSVCFSAGARLVLDETYRDFLPPDHGPPHDLLSTGAEREAFVQLYSFSKSFAIPGHRLGALLAAPDLVAEAVKVMDNLQICAPRATQRAVAETLETLAPWRARNAVRIATRAEAFRRAIAAAPGWEIVSLGAYFAYVRHPFAGSDATDVARRLAAEAGVSTLPGPFFGAGQEAFVRMAFANAGTDVIADLPDRLAAIAPPPSSSGTPAG